MTEIEYKTIAAPRRVRKVKGVKGKDELAAYAIGEIIQEQAAEGWRYLRADTFSIEEKSGMFSGWREVERTVLVFSRELRRTAFAAPQAQPQPAAPIAAPQPAPAPVAAPAPAPAPHPQQAVAQAVTATRAEPAATADPPPHPLGGAERG